MYTLSFQDISSRDIKNVGGKATALKEIVSIGLMVPEGFVLTTKSYNEFNNRKLSESFKSEVYNKFDILKMERVAIRSSAVGEDSPKNSFAGQLESYLNISRENIFTAIRKCWSSVKSKRVKAYAKMKKIDSGLSIAVIIQKMINSEKSGILFTSNPMTNSTHELIIEAGYGLGKLLVQGQITPDNYIVSKERFEWIRKTKNDQRIMLTYNNQHTQKAHVSEKLKGKPVLITKEIKKLASIGIKIENFYKQPQDIEWSFHRGKFYILQSRQIIRELC